MSGSGEKRRTSEAGFFCPSYVGVRCFLLLFVLEGHYWFEEYRIPELTPLTFAVPCFFALSGFLISHTLFEYEKIPRAQALKIFFIRRVFRILPAFYLVLIVANLVKAIPYFWWQFCYLINWKIYLLSANEPFAFIHFMNYGDFRAIHFWSVAVEEQFYLLYPLFVFFTPQRWRTQLLGLGIVGTILARFWFLTYQPETFYGGLSIVTGEYILWGCLFAWLDRHQKIGWLCNSRALYASVVAFGLLAVFDRSYGTMAQWQPKAHQTVYALIIATFVLSLRYSTGSALGRALAWKGWTPIGRVSYGAYLIHLFLNPVAEELAHRLPWLNLFPQCPKAITGPLVTLLVATAMWHLYEQPINRLRQRWRSDS